MDQIKKPIKEEWILWQRNVIDEYKPLSNEEIKLDLKKKALPYAVCGQHINGDFNISQLMRSANHFGAEKFFYFGKKRFDPRGSVGVKHYLDIEFLSSIEELKKLKVKYTFVGLENTNSTNMLHDFIWPKQPEQKKPLIIIGEEGNGIAPEVLELCDHIVEIANLGSVRSLNTATAGSLAMYDIVSKLKYRKQA
jgi:tRNA G18 (ribose-2'-O)-methylase SpoU